VLAACDRRAPALLKTGGTEAAHVARLFWIMFALAAAVYVVVAGLIIGATLRGRGTETGKPSRAKDEAFVWVGGLVIPVVILAVLAALTVATTNQVRRPARGALAIEVVGKRWWWAVSYPGTGVTTANEIHVPVGRQIRIGLDSDNVIHSFWVPQVAGKLDTIPGQHNELRLTVTKAGTYRGECAEFCGLQHANMNLVFVAQNEADFQRWLVRREAAPTAATSDLTEQGLVVFQRAPCAGCHTIRATSATGTVGPDLTDFGSRQTIGSGTVANDPAHLALWIADSQSIKPGNLMPPVPLSSSELKALVAYLESLK
jgi:cytochrome c oxidase subunit 2